MDEMFCNTTKTDQKGFNFLDPKEKYLWSKINTSLFTQILETQKQKKMHYVGISFPQGEYNVSTETESKLNMIQDDNNWGLIPKSPA